jgi:hypothetical protein
MDDALHPDTQAMLDDEQRDLESAPRRLERERRLKAKKDLATRKAQTAKRSAWARREK